MINTTKEPPRGINFQVTFNYDTNGNSSTSVSSSWGRTHKQMDPKFSFGDWNAVADALNDHFTKKEALREDTWETLCYSRDDKSKALTFNVICRYVRPL